MEFRQSFYPETLGGSLAQLNVGENQTSIIYELVFSMLDSAQTTYFMQFILAKGCNKSLSLVQIYSYNRTQATT